MRFLVDAQLPAALARWLAAEGHRAEHVADIGLAGAPDKAIWEYALAAGAVIVTKDEDFSQLKALKVGGPTVVWIRLPNTRKQQLLLWLENVLPTLLRALERGETLIELV
jgi:predicted nuclease of predicted toxin-antitoxin system